MNGDAISRKQVIKRIKKAMAGRIAPLDKLLFKELITVVAHEIPSVDDGWIPIEEREPDTADHVLVTARWDDLDYEVFELDYGVTKALANRQGNIHQDYCKNLIEHIIAWQYKPEPYIEDGGINETDNNKLSLWGN